MRRFWLLVLAATLGLPATLPAATYDIDPAHSSVSFSIRHLVGRVPGSFSGFSGTIEYDPSKPEASVVNAVIQAASITTENETRDAHLRSADFFDVEKFPQITFASTAVRKTDAGLEVEGKLAMHGVEKTVTLPVEILGTATDPWGKTRTGFSAELTLDRTQFGIIWNKALDQGGALLGNDVKVTLLMEAVAR